MRDESPLPASSSGVGANTGADDGRSDPRALIRTRPYRALLVLAAVIGLVVSTVCWLFLEAVHEIEVGVYEDLSKHLGYGEAPRWWPLPWLVLAALLTAFAIERLPGRGGHVPADGLKTGGPPQGPADIPGVALAGLATLSLGLVLGPEAPLLAIGSGLGILALSRLRRNAPEQTLTLMAAAGSFAAIASIFGSPVVGAVIIIEAAGIGGAMLPVVLLPGLLSAGIGSLVFIGLGSFSGFSTAAWTLEPFPLTAFGGPSWGDFGWTIVLAVAAAAVTFAIMELARLSLRLVRRQRFFFTILAGLAVGGLAIAFAEITGYTENAVLFSGESAFGGLFGAAPTLALSTLALLLLLKGLAWSISLGSFRGGPTFPAIFLGVVAGMLAGHLPGYAETPAIAVLVGAGCVSVLRLPLSSLLLASLLTTHAGLAVTPLVVVGVAVAYLTSEGLSAYVDQRIGHAERAPAESERTAAMP